VLQQVSSLACHISGVEEAVVLLRGRGRITSLVAVAVSRCGRPAAPVAEWRADDAAIEGALAAGGAVAEGEPGSRCSAAAPLVVQGEVRGVLAVCAAAPDKSFDTDQLQLLAQLADLASSALKERDLRARAEAVLDAGADVLARAVDIRDEYTGRHSSQVGDLARRVGQRIGMRPAEVELLQCAARLHDVGKLGVPDSILQKPGPLDEAEWSVMRCHPDWGAEMVARVPGLGDLAALVRAHHERWDGGGYPAGLAGEEIPLASRVISVCDAYEAMVSRRPYRAPLTVDEALAELIAGAGTQFDPKVVAAVEIEAACEPLVGVGLA
jgi:hypothetical protein